MKVCKKCKTHVANKAKICKKCGADVSKAKIIKSATTTPKSKTTKQKTTPIKETKSQNKNKVVVTQEQNKKTANKKQSETKTKKKDKVTVTPKKDKKKSSNKTTINKKKQVNKAKEVGQKSFDILKAVFIYFGTEIYQSVKTTAVILWDIIKTFGKTITEIFGRKLPNQIKKTHTKIKTIQENKPKKNKEEKYVTYKLEDYEEQISKKQKNKEPTKHRRLKYAIVSVFIISVVAGLYFVGQDIYQDLTGTANRIVVTEQATTEKVFSMEDIITYNNVDYKVVKIETSKGNSYKSPKPGHQFLIVTVYIKNNTDKKVPYSYENWTMSNSKGEEKKRIFSSINVDTALYSGELVIGGIKTGSMVFEQPVNDPKLKMNFYELKKDDDGNEVIDESKRVFSISVKVPNKKAKIIKEKTKNEDVKVVKTNTKNKS